MGKFDRRNELEIVALENEADDAFTWADAQAEAEKNFSFVEDKFRFLHKEESWNRFGLQNLVQRAMDEFRRTTGCSLPWNLANYGPYYQGSWGKRFPLDETGKKIVEETARFCGWLKSTTKFPVLIELIKRATSGNGVNSPYTVLDLWSLSERFSSPGKAMRFLLKVRRRANDILSAYGLHVSWWALGRVMSCGTTKSIGKQARRAAAQTVREFIEGCKNPIGRFYCEYEDRNKIHVLIKARGLKDLLAASRAIQIWAFEAVMNGEFDCFRSALSQTGRLVEDSTDGVELLLDLATSETKHGITSVKGFDGVSSYWLISARNGSLSFHSSTYYKKRRRAVEEALDAWKRQVASEAYNKEIFKSLLPEDRCFLVYVEDSWAVGNCRPGTAAWMRQNGFAGRKFISVEELLRYADDSRVKRVLQGVAQRLSF